MGKIYTLRLDKDALESYTKEYFKVYPKRRKAPLDKPFVPSLNKYLVMNKDARNNLKERWEEFVYHSCQEQGLLNLGLNKCRLKVTYVFGDKRKSDLDNRILKCPLDGMVRAGVIVDDNRFVIGEILSVAEYEARNPHMIIEIEELDYFFSKK